MMWVGCGEGDGSPRAGGEEERDVASVGVGALWVRGTRPAGSVEAGLKEAVWGVAKATTRV